MRKNKLSGKQGQELGEELLSSLPEADDLGVLGLLQFGSATLLKEAITNEILRATLGESFTSTSRVAKSSRETETVTGELAPTLQSGFGM